MSPSPITRPWGSSPLARGLQEAATVRQGQRGIIPARAGFTSWSSGRSTGTRDHPRSRGVYTVVSTPWRMDLGSSPLARGLRHGVREEVRVHGIIPARAGFTPSCPPRGGWISDHPRSRGVYYAADAPAEDFDGSSPLARGLHTGGVGALHEPRIIPARAGFTPSSTASASAPSDHPRSRGVYTPPYQRKGPAAGSSPLARGLRRLRVRLRGRRRIIPARAGFTPSSTASASAPSDHPRSRGVYTPPYQRKGPAAGSSPLARGLRRLRVRLRGRRRIIPARAGFTR